MTCTLAAAGQAEQVTLRMAGRHQALNAAAAVAAGTALGIDLVTLASGLSRAEGSPWRMEITTGPVTVVNDAYNANPDSVASALRTVADLPGRHLAVLGEMAELGEVAAEEHVKIGKLAVQLGYTAVVVVGNDPGIAAGAGSLVVPVDDAVEAERVVGDMMRRGDVVLVKASRVVGLEQLAARLAEVSVS